MYTTATTTTTTTTTMPTTTRNEVNETDDNSSRMRTFRRFHGGDDEEDDHRPTNREGGGGGSGELHYDHEEEDEDDVGTTATAMVLTADGYCARHPHIQLRGKDPITGQPYIIREFCPECQWEFQQSKLMLQQRQAQLDRKLQMLEQHEQQRPHNGSSNGSGGNGTSSNGGSRRGDRSATTAAMTATTASPFSYPPPPPHHQYPYGYYHPTAPPPPHPMSKDDYAAHASPYGPVPPPSHLPYSPYQPHPHLHHPHVIHQQQQQQGHRSPHPGTYREDPAASSSYSSSTTTASSGKNMASTAGASPASTSHGGAPSGNGTGNAASTSSSSSSSVTAMGMEEIMTMLQPKLQSWIEDVISKEFVLFQQKQEETMQTQWKALQEQQEHQINNVLQQELRTMVASMESTLHTNIITTTNTVDRLLELQQYNQKLKQELLEQQQQGQQQLLGLLMQQQQQQQDELRQRLEKAKLFQEPPHGLSEGTGQNQDNYLRGSEASLELDEPTFDDYNYQNNGAEASPNVAGSGMTNATTKTNQQTKHTTTPSASPSVKQMAARMNHQTALPPDTSANSNNTAKMTTTNRSKKHPWQGGPALAASTATDYPNGTSSKALVSAGATSSSSNTKNRTNTTKKLLGEKTQDEDENDSLWNSQDVTWNSHDSKKIGEDKHGAGGLSSAPSPSNDAQSPHGNASQPYDDGEDDMSSRYHPGDSLSVAEHLDSQLRHEQQQQQGLSGMENGLKDNGGMDASPLGNFEGDVDDQHTLEPTVASSTCDEDRQRVTHYTLLDPYGDQGIYTGIILRTTGMPHGSGKMMYEGKATVVAVSTLKALSCRRGFLVVGTASSGSVGLTLIKSPLNLFITLPYDNH